MATCRGPGVWGLCPMVVLPCVVPTRWGGAVRDTSAAADCYTAAALPHALPHGVHATGVYIEYTGLTTSGSFYTTTVWLLELYPAKIIQSFQQQFRPV